MELLTNFFNQYQTIILLILIVLLIYLIIEHFVFRFRLKKFMRGENGKSLEASFVAMQKELDGFFNFKKELEVYIGKLEKRVRKSIQSVENINFSAFKGMDSGGKSFATAFLNENGDGVIISTLQARDRLSVFSKQIRKFKAESILTEEETEALTKARQSCSL